MCRRLAGSVPRPPMGARQDPETRPRWCVLTAHSTGPGDPHPVLCSVLGTGALQADGSPGPSLGPLPLLVCLSRLRCHELRASGGQGVWGPAASLSSLGLASGAALAGQVGTPRAPWLWPLLDSQERPPSPFPPAR